jgi:tetratricopeptide (TPR) repeat protein
VYPDPRVIDYVTQHFVPVRVHVKDNAADFKRLGDRFVAHWTPTVLLVDSTETERYRFEGFLPADDFLSQLALGRAKAAFSREDYAAAERLYREVLERFPDTDAAPEAQYWAGVSRYRATNDAAALKATSQAFRERYRDSTWAKKASVWV